MYEDFDHPDAGGRIGDLESADRQLREATIQAAKRLDDRQPGSI